MRNKARACSRSGPGHGLGLGQGAVCTAEVEAAHPGMRMGPCTWLLKPHLGRFISRPWSERIGSELVQGMNRSTET